MKERLGGRSRDRQRTRTEEDTGTEEIPGDLFFFTYQIREQDRQAIQRARGDTDRERETRRAGGGHEWNRVPPQGHGSVQNSMVNLKLQFFKLTSLWCVCSTAPICQSPVSHTVWAGL